MTAILMGYTVTMFESRKVFIKHFGPIDSLETDYQYNLAYDSAIKKGLKCEKDKLEELNKEGLWTHKDEETVKEKFIALTQMYKTKSKLHVPSQVAAMTENIKKSEDAYRQLKNTREQLLRHTAEKKGEKRAEDYYIYSSFFNNKELTDSFFVESFDDVDGDLLLDLKRLYYKAFENILNDKIKYVALTKEFLDLVYMAERPYEILGKPYVQYTFFQTDLINLGRLYKHILSSDTTIPEAIKSDPEKLETWWETSQNAKNLLEKRGKVEIGDGVNTMVGMSSKELKEMYGEHSVVSMDTQIKEAAAKSGKSVLNINDLMKIKGI